jgi:hypothetical protein
VLCYAWQKPAGLLFPTRLAWKLIFANFPLCFSHTTVPAQAKILVCIIDTNIIGRIIGLILICSSLGFRAMHASFSNTNLWAIRNPIRRVSTLIYWNPIIKFILVMNWIKLINEFSMSSIHEETDKNRFLYSQNFV